MDHHVPVIHQDPSSLVFPFLAERPDSLFSQFFLNRLGNGLNLAVRLTATEDEVISKGTNPFHFKQDEIKGLFLNRCLYTEQEFCLRIADHTLLKHDFLSVAL